MSGTNDRISGSVHQMLFRIENGKPIVKREKTVTAMRKDVGSKSPQAIKVETTEICKKANKASHNPVSDMKRKVSKDLRDDLELYKQK